MPQSEFDNPFNITKATDFSNEEIATYWVDFYSNEGLGLLHYLNPNDLTPKYVIGGKGCGKTHLLRYYSFPIQKIRYSGNIERLVEYDKYIGFTLELGSMNSARMSGCCIDNEQWDVIFGYYIELFAGLNLITTIIEVFDKLRIAPEKETKIIQDIKEQVFATSNFDFDDTLLGFKAYLNKQKKLVDYNINNAALRRGIDFTQLSIELSPGAIFFQVPQILANNVAELSKMKFIFILDELEKLEEYQKVYINTLVWDKRKPTTFWVGARTFGFTTRLTKSGETLRNGSEYHHIKLDEIMREDEDRYKAFAISLCTKRLASIVSFPSDSNSDTLKNEIEKYFESFDEKELISSLNKTTRKELPHQTSFKANLREAIKKSLIKGVSVGDIDQLFEHNIKEMDLLLEKYKMLHFYKQWSKTSNVNEILAELTIETENYRNSPRKSKLKGYEEKYKIDFLAQLIFENNMKIFPYTGINNFIKISSGNPRSLLVILKEIFERAKNNVENPFVHNSKISIDSQSLGIYYSSKWFYENTGALGEDGKKLYKCIYNLASLFQGIRYSDKPSETSPSSFSYKPEKTSEMADKFIVLSEVYSVLIPVKPRHDKNSDRVEKSYQINRMLCPYFNLPISRRGIVPLNQALIEVIFNPEKHINFQSLYSEFIDRMNAPFGTEVQPEMF